MTQSLIKKGGIILLLIVSSITFSSCRVVDYFTKQSANEYRNAITVQLNDLTPAVEQTLTAYDEAIPDSVTEESTIDTEKLDQAVLGLDNAVAKIPAALAEESFDTDLQNAVQAKLQEEQTVITAYQQTYKEMVAFYKNGTYKTSLNDVETQDTKTQDAYNALVDAHNATVDALGVD